MMIGRTGSQARLQAKVSNIPCNAPEAGGDGGKKTYEIRSFDEAEEESNRQKAAKAGRCSRGCGNDAPNDHANWQVNRWFANLVEEQIRGNYWLVNKVLPMDMLVQNRSPCIKR